MKRITIRLIVTLCTFIIGVIVATTWLIRPVPSVPDISLIDVKVDIPSPQVSKTTSDPTVYSVKFCELIRNSDKYDGKIVRIQTSYRQGIDTSALTDSKCEDWLRPQCDIKEVHCKEIWDRIAFRNLRLDVVGRYTADIVDPNPLQNGYHVRLFEILELKSAKPEKRRKR
jgi:hypothetical protein